MYRKFYRILEEWEQKKTKEPLLVIGARQVGKTWIIQRFCEEEYENYVYLNFESNAELDSVFSGNLEPDFLLMQLEILLGRKITKDTALFFDEIQQSERAITALKYFCESEINYRIIAAGSLLGVKLNRFGDSFPVGKVKIVHMYPLDFEEFLLACEQSLLRDAILEAYQKGTALSEPVHKKAILYYQDYLFVGGMPQCVKEYRKKEENVVDFDRSIQENLLLAYAADMTKYTVSAAEGVKINEVYHSIPKQLARENPKFKYKEVRPNANKRDFRTPIDWLDSSGMVYKVDKISTPQSPLKSYADENNFKIYLSDTGLLSCLAGIRYKNLLSVEHNIYKGAVTENYVIQSLVSMNQTPYFYKPSDSMEIDVLLDTEEGILPVEIKSGRHKRSTSLKNYNEKFSPAKMIRISENNFGKADTLLSLPLYAVFCLK